ncbi:27023_t:CDS:2, partial [Racocetra persica]
TYIKELGEIKIKECKIFALIMGKDKSAFSLHVNYVDDETSEIIVHLIQHKTKKKRLTPKLCWIIVGLPAHINFDPINYLIILRSKKYSKFEKNNYCIVKINELSSLSKSCILCTCVLEPDIITDSSGSIDDNSSIISAPNNTSTMSELNSTINNSVSYNTVMTKVIKDISSIIIGTHITLSKHSACLFGYDRNKELDKNILQRLSLHVCVTDEIVSPETCNFQTGLGIPLEVCSSGQMEVIWHKSKTRKGLSYGKNTLFANNQVSENLIFVNQLFDCFENGSENCQYHGSANVKP